MNINGSRVQSFTNKPLTFEMFLDTSSDDHSCNPVSSMSCHLTMDPFTCGVEPGGTFSCPSLLEWCGSYHWGKHILSTINSGDQLKHLLQSILFSTCPNMSTICLGVDQDPNKGAVRKINAKVNGRALEFVSDSNFSEVIKPLHSLEQMMARVTFSSSAPSKVLPDCGTSQMPF